MKTKSKNNLLIGAKVLIDWPVRWKGCENKSQETMRLEVAKKEAFFGRTGIIIAYHPGEETGKEYSVLLDDNTIEEFFSGALTITAPAPDENAPVAALLADILNVLKAIKDK